MPTAESAGRVLPSQAAPSPHFARYAWGVLAYNVAVVLWGAYVRATGSGAGCGNHWPLCNGEITPHSPSSKMLIEFTHRVSSGLDGLLVVLLVFWAFRAFPKLHPARLGAALSGTFLVTEALLGAMLVKLGLVENNASPARGFADAAHLVNTFCLLAAIALTAWWGADRPAIRARGRRAWLAAASLAFLMLLGISGVIAALGDTLFPVASLRAGFAQDLDAAANILLRLRLWHPVIAGVAAAWLAFYTFTAADHSARSRTLAWAVAVLFAAQIAAGILNLALLAPVWMQMLHLLLGDAVWISLVLLCARDLEAEPA